ncbi:MAG: hypothetical protein WBA72_09125 [Ornithinimicrobium sp.]
MKVAPPPGLGSSVGACALMLVVTARASGGQSITATDQARLEARPEAGNDPARATHAGSGSTSATDPTEARPTVTALPADRCQPATST